jgi:type IV pilus assembly protein PilY1
MKAALQFVTSLLALGGLLVSAATHATDIAELPLKASVLAKPNVIFGLDDSGSMDSEVMINTNDGAFWWDYNAASGWDSAGLPWFNAPGNASTQWRKMVYLFPNGQAGGTTNAVRAYADATDDHFAIPPTAQLAFLRSAAYNPIYYDPAVTYSPWSTAWVSSAKKSFAKATPAAARSHPIYPLTGTAPSMNLTATVAANTAANFSFMALPGMRLPGTALVCAGTCGTWPTVATRGWVETPTGSGFYTVPAATKMNVAMDYFPATYYQKESCTVDGSNCVTAPDGSTLKRYEIKLANYATTAEYNKAIENFANWWTYFRKRKLMLSASMGKVLEPLTGLRMDVVVFNNNQNVTMYDIDSTDPSKNRLKVTGLFYETNGNGGTPTRETLKYIGGQYLSNSKTIQYACQRNNAYILTDGFASASAVSGPAYDSGKSASTWGAGVPYETIYSPSLADLALRYYTNNLRSTFTAGRVPVTTGDTNTDLHMNTYGMTLGAKGTIYLGAGTPLPTTTSAWPNPTATRSPTSVDDLWHATINGRGKMYTASTPTETAASIQAGLKDILNDSNAQSSVAVSTVNLQAGDGLAYLASYNAAGWSGNVTANAIDETTAVITDAPTWDGGALLLARDYTTREIATQTGGAGTGAAFAAGNASVTSQVNPSAIWGADADVMAYLRGARTLEGTSFRTRSSLMGAVINAEPVVSKEPTESVVYVASGEGMLHAFNADKTSANKGKELWAFVPRAVLADIGQTSERTYAFKTQLDGTPTIGKAGTGLKLLVAGLGAAGNSYYALDVTTPLTNTQSNASTWVKWDFPGTATSAYASKVGQTMGRPLIVRIADGTYRVLVTSGYNSTADGKGRLFVLDPVDGSVQKEFVTPDGTLSAESGLTHVTPYAEDDGSVRYVFGGDLLGNLWRFDLSAASLTAPKKVAVLKDATGKAQPVTAAPELTNIKGQRVVLIGTGRLLAVTDWGTTSSKPDNTFYAITDPDLAATIDPARSSLVQQVYTGHTTDTVTTTATTDLDWTTQRGWYMDLPSTEHANTRPVIAFGGIAFVTNVAGTNDCSALSYLYVLDITTGGKSANVSYVSQELWSTSNSTGVTAVKTKAGDVKGMVRSYDGDRKTPDLAKNVTIDPSKNAWREIRQ